jgi:hypothetical protein
MTSHWFELLKSYYSGRNYVRISNDRISARINIPSVDVKCIIISAECPHLVSKDDYLARLVVAIDMMDKNCTIPRDKLPQINRPNIEELDHDGIRYHWRIFNSYNSTYEIMVRMNKSLWQMNRLSSLWKQIRANNALKSLELQCGILRYYGNLSYRESLEQLNIAIEVHDNVVRLNNWGDIETLTFDKSLGNVYPYLVLWIATTTMHEIRSELPRYPVLISNAMSNIVPLYIPATEVGTCCRLLPTKHRKHIKVRHNYVPYLGEHVVSFEVGDITHSHIPRMFVLAGAMGDVLDDVIAFAQDVTETNEISTITYNFPIDVHIATYGEIDTNIVYALISCGIRQYDLRQYLHSQNLKLHMLVKLPYNDVTTDYYMFESIEGYSHITIWPRDDRDTIFLYGDRTYSREECMKVYEHKLTNEEHVSKWRSISNSHDWQRQLHLAEVPCKRRQHR